MAKETAAFESKLTFEGLFQSFRPQRLVTLCFKQLQGGNLLKVWLHTFLDSNGVGPATFESLRIFSAVMYPAEYVQTRFKESCVEYQQ
jgi:hypothetical protein